MLGRTASAETNASGGSTSRRRSMIVRAARWAALAAAVVVCTAVGVIGAIWLRMDPLPLSRAEAVSVTVLDRNDRLLRAYTAADGRWRLPLDVKEVDPRYLAMLIAFEDKRFRSHHGVDPWAVGRAAWQLIGHRRIVSGGSTLTMQVARLLQGEHERTRRRQDPPVAARAGARAAAVQGCHPAPLPAAGAVRRQPGRRAGGLARLFRQGAEAAVAG